MRRQPAGPDLGISYALGHRTVGGLTGGGAGYQPVTFYSEGSWAVWLPDANLELRAHAHHLAAVETGPTVPDRGAFAACGVPVCSVRAQPSPDDHVTSFEEADAWIGRIGLDSAGRKIGKITRVWIDDYSGLPTWATLESGRFDRREGIAPLSNVTATRGRPQLACTKAEVMSAPPVDDDGHLGLDDEWRLINHYRLAGTPDPTRQDPAGEHPNSMTRMTTSTRTRPGSRPPGPGSSSSAAQVQDQRTGQGGPSGRLFLPGMRRRLGLG